MKTTEEMVIIGKELKESLHEFYGACRYGYDADEIFKKRFDDGKKIFIEVCQENKQFFAEQKDYLFDKTINLIKNILSLFDEFIKYVEEKNRLIESRIQIIDELLK